MKENPKYVEMTMAQLEHLLGKNGKAKMDELNEAMSDIGRQIAADQQEWVDRCMKDLLPPNLYDDATHLRNLEAVAAYARKNDIRLVYMNDTLRLRIMVRDKIYGEWKANLTVDGDKVEFRPVGNNGN